MAHSFMRPSGTKRATSLMLSIVMLATMVMPAFAVAVVTPSNYKAGTLSAAATNLTSVDGTGSAGYLGVYSFEVTGTPATRAFVQSNAQYLTEASKLIALSDLNVPTPLDASTLPVVSYSDVTTTFATPVAGLTPASTITDVVNAINTQFAAYMTASFDAAFRVRLTAKKVGSVTMGITDNYAAIVPPAPVLSLGMADAVFRGVAAPGDWAAIDGATSGTDYSDGSGAAPSYGTVGGLVSFKPLGGKKYNVGSTIGYMAAGVFTPGVDPATGFYTAIKLGAGHDFVIRTSGALDVRPGMVSFEAADGVRAPVDAGNSWIGQGGNQQAGQEETISIQAHNHTGLADATNGARIVLPAGFTVAAPDSVTFAGQPASFTVSADRTTIEFYNFQADLTGDITAPVSWDPFMADVRVKNATASDNTLGLDGSAAKPFRKASLLTRNVAGTAWTEFATTDLYVDSEDIVGAAGVKLLSTEINAGGYSRITGQLFDQYNNEIVEHGRAITFDLASTTPTPAGSFSPSFIATGAPDSPFETSFRTSVTDGQNVVRATVLKTVAGTETVAGTTIVDTRNVGNPYQVLVLEKDGKTSFPTTGTPTFYVKVVDQAGKGTSFLTDRKVKVVMSDNFGNTNTYWADIPAGFSTSADFGFGSPMGADMWKLTATDWFGGQALPSNVLSIDFSGAVIPGAPFEMKVSAVKPIPGDSMDTDYNEFLFNNTAFTVFGINAAAFGYANADGQQAVEFTAQVVDNAGMPINQAGIEVTYTIPAPPNGFISGVTYPGVLSAKTGVTDANGRVTVKMTSTVGSRERFAPRVFSDYWPNDGLETTYFTPVSFETTLPASDFDYGFGYFVKGKLVHMTTDKGTILADGTDAATITMHAMDQAFGMPAAGVRLAVSTSAGSLSSTSVVTGADGMATVSLKSNSVNPSSALVVAVDPDGNRANVEVFFSDLRINVAPVGSGTAQGGYGASQDVRVSFSRLDGTPVLFDGFNANWLSFDGGYLDFSKFETATAEGGSVLNSAAIYTATLDNGNAIGSWNVEIADVDVYRNLGVFGFSDNAPQTASTKLNFVNNATFSATLVKGNSLYYDNSRLNYVGGSGFNAPANGGLYRNIEVGLPNGDNGDVEFQSAQVRSDGSIAPIKGIWTGDELNFLVAGMSYDLRVDGIIIKDALVVSDWAPMYGQTAQIYAGTLPSGQVKIYGVARELLSSELRRGASVDLQVWTGSGWIDEGNALTAIADDNGEFSWTLPVPAKNSVKYYRVRVQAVGEYTEGYSFTGTPVAPVKNEVVKVMGRVNSIVTLTSPTTAKANVYFYAKGKATSYVAGEKATIKVYRKTGGKYVLKNTYMVTVSSTGTFSKKVRYPAGYYKITASYNGGSASDFTSVR